MEKPTHRDAIYVKELYRAELVRLSKKIGQAREGGDDPLALWLTETHAQLSKSAARVMEYLGRVSSPKVVKNEGQHPEN